MDFAAQHLEAFTKGDVRTRALPSATVATETSQLGSVAKSMRASSRSSSVRRPSSSPPAPRSASPSADAADATDRSAYWQVPRYSANALGTASSGAMLVANLIFAILDDVRFHVRRELTVGTGTIASSAGFLAAIDPCALLWEGPLQFAVALAGPAGFISTHTLCNHRIIPALLDIIDGEQQRNVKRESDSDEALKYTIEDPLIRDQLYVSVRELTVHHGVSLMKYVSSEERDPATREELVEVLVGYAVHVGLPMSRCLRSEAMLVHPDDANDNGNQSRSSSPVLELVASRDGPDESRELDPTLDAPEAIFHSIVSSGMLALAAGLTAEAASADAESPLPDSIVNLPTETMDELLQWIATARHAALSSRQGRNPQPLVPRRSSSLVPTAGRSASFRTTPVSAMSTLELARSGAELYITTGRAFGVALRHLNLEERVPLMTRASDTIQTLFGELALDAFESALADDAESTDLLQKLRRLLGALSPELLTEVEKSRLEWFDRRETDALCRDEMQGRESQDDAEASAWNEILEAAEASWNSLPPLAEPETVEEEGEEEPEPQHSDALLPPDDTGDAGQAADTEQPQAAESDGESQSHNEEVAPLDEEVTDEESADSDPPEPPSTARWPFAQRPPPSKRQTQADVKPNPESGSKRQLLDSSVDSDSDDDVGLGFPDVDHRMDIGGAAAFFRSMVTRGTRQRQTAGPLASAGRKPRLDPQRYMSKEEAQRHRVTMEQTLAAEELASRKEDAARLDAAKALMGAVCSKAKGEQPQPFPR